MKKILNYFNLAKVSSRFFILITIILLVNTYKCFGFGAVNFIKLYNIDETTRLILIIVGIALLALGFYLWEIVIFIPGAIIGGIIGLVFGAFQGGDAGLIYGLIGAVAGGLLALAFHWLIVFLSGAAVGAILFQLIFGLNSLDINEPGLVISAIIFGILAIIFWKFLVIVVTSVLGAISFSIGTGNVYNTGFVILLILVGIGIQYGIHKIFGLPLVKDKEDSKRIQKAYQKSILLEKQKNESENSELTTTD